MARGAGGGVQAARGTRIPASPSPTVTVESLETQLLSLLGKDTYSPSQALETGQDENLHGG